MSFLVDTVLSDALIFRFTNAERKCLKESQAEGNPYLAGGLGMPFSSLCK